MQKKLIWLVVVVILLSGIGLALGTAGQGTTTTVLSSPTTTLKKKPDLVVSNLKVVPSKKKSQTVLVTYEIKDQGAPINEKTNIQLQLLDEQGNVVDTRQINQIDIGAPKGSATFKVGDRKRYTVKATADYNNFIRETDETNNSRQVSFGVGVKF